MTNRDKNDCGPWKLEDLAEISPLIHDNAMRTLTGTARELSDKISHQLFELTSMDERDKPLADRSAQLTVALSMLKMSIAGLRVLEFPHDHMLIALGASGALSATEVEILSQLAKLGLSPNARSIEIEELPLRRKRKKATRAATKTVTKRRAKR